MLSAQGLASHFSTALPYAQYVASGTEEQQRRWRQAYELAALDDSQKQLVSGFSREMKVLIISGIWCGDCVQQCPLLERIAEANREKVQLRFVDRDQHRELIEPLRINGGDRVPVAIFMAEDFEFCQSYGDRTLSRYRAMALRQLGAACPIGVAAPDRDELSATLGDWLGEFERIQLMLLLSARLRQKHEGPAK